MTEFKVTKPLTLGVGNEVILTSKQAAARNLCLSLIEDNKYMILRNTIFKQGEVIGFDEIPEKRIIEDCLEPVGTEPDNLVKRRSRRKNVQ